MQKRILPIAVIAITIISLIGWSCTKLDTTDIGGDQLPAVDNVHTFDTTLLINSSQGYFNDTITAVGIGEDHAVGSISNDPIFGRTTANIFMQVKPSFYPYYFGNAGDTLVALDSVVLCLKYTGFWGDNTTPVRLEVREINDVKFKDSFARVNRINYEPSYSGSPLLGSANIDSRRLADTVKYRNGKNYSVNQIRIKITDPTWINRLFGRDTISTPGNNAFRNDSIYRILYNGLAVVANGPGNGLLYVSIADTATKLEIHYKKRKSGVTDTAYSSFRINTSYGDIKNNPPSSTGNFVSRDRSGSPSSFLNSNEHFLQTSPGTFVNLNIPGLATFPNAIIHRAEITIEQVPANALTDSAFSAPNFLYLDLKDTGAANKYKPVYYDLNTGISYDPDNKTGYYFPSGGQIDFNYFGGYKRKKTNATGTFNFYTFNISRYIQHLITEHRPNYGLRVWAPFDIFYPQYATELISFSNNIAYGRVKIGSATNVNHPLKLRIIYSKL